MNSGTQTLVHGFLEASARLRPDKLALVHNDVRATYGQVNAMANSAASWLLEQGIAAGDRVVIFLENSLEYVVAYYGVMKTAGVAVPLNFDVKSYSLDAVLDELRPSVVITGKKFENLFRECDPARFGIRKLLIKDPTLPPRSCSCGVDAWDDAIVAGTLPDPGLSIGEGELANIIYTSGSTGKPKGVMLSHKNIVSNTLAIVQYLELEASDIQMVVLPFFYVMGKSLLNTHFAVGGTVVVNNRFAFPACVVEQMITERVTGFSGVPSTYAYLLHRSTLAACSDKLGTLRYCTQAGGHMPRQVKERLLEILPHHTRLFIMYGATEASARLTYVEPERLREKFDSIGIPIPGVVIRVLDQEGHEVPAGQTGELVAGGPNIMQGYWRDPVSTSVALDANGYHTGDLGYRDRDGYLYVTGRKDHQLKVGGHRINPQEIEDAMMATDLLLEAVVLGLEDPLLGQRLVAVAAPIDKMTSERDVLARSASMLPRYKLPAEIRFTGSLPKNANGKINRTACRELFA